jgi:hypothetical protein
MGRSDASLVQLDRFSICTWDFIVRQGLGSAWFLWMRSFTNQGTGCTSTGATMSRACFSSVLALLSVTARQACTSYRHNIIQAYHGVFLPLGESLVQGLLPTSVSNASAAAEICCLAIPNPHAL